MHDRGHIPAGGIFGRRPRGGRATGGLRDTVQPIRVMGTRYGERVSFSDYSTWAFYDAMERTASFSGTARSRYSTGKDERGALRLFLDKPARQYVETIYELTETIRVLD